jgi:hypothetical protein
MNLINEINGGNGVCHPIRETAYWLMTPTENREQITVASNNN